MVMKKSLLNKVNEVKVGKTDKKKLNKNNWLVILKNAINLEGSS